MRYLFKSIFFLFVLTQTITNRQVTYLDVVGILVMVILNIVREKYINSKWLLVVEFGIILMFVQLNPYFIIFYGMLTHDLIFKEIYWGLLPSVALGVYFLTGNDLYNYILIIFLCSFFAYISKELTYKERNLRKAYDSERKFTYELEATKNKLMNSSKEIAHLTEVKERNRIAREIHDNIGHSIAGILMQMQVVEKLYDKDSKKSKELLGDSVEKLANTLVILRDTVHNIKPKEELGIEYIRKLVENFSFCPVQFKCRGDFNHITTTHLEILTTNIKEALTNVTKHSNASKVEVSIDCNEKFTRLYIKDNGVGCEDIKENLGISGMRERVRNAGGSFSVSNDHGLLIVSVLPVDCVGGGRILEGFNCRR
ncbi:integral membrane sensor signal transduction histidine kinase [Alkaliphilus metalliredigens QYMF]|uniref:histidine kinase n=1 Tax=Alkaliphilus metalliredigens (strain QYMF) TaxID=293826 RepID=A6TVR5_ALKMQ|nr:integral membrane sensor signal transduction histidine kinase [Alkaliphilus metalliredigens QYMF]